MAVYTHITEDDLKTHLTRFDLGELLSFEGISEGVENTNYKLETTAGRFILTLFEKRADAEELPFYITFMEFAREQGVPAPLAAPAKSGEKIVALNGKPSVITTFLEGVWSKEPTVAQCAALGEMLAKLHAAGRKFSLRRKNTMALFAWKSLILACLEGADRIGNNLGDTLQGELDFLEKNWPKYLQKGAVHADLFPDNVFFLGDEISGVIDFYFSCTDAFAYDLMLTLNAWCFDRHGAFFQDKAAALLKAYHAKRPLPPLEVKSLSFFGRAAAVRIIATRLYDWLNPVEGALVKPKDPLEHVRILKFHQAVKSAADYGFTP